MKCFDCNNEATSSISSVGGRTLFLCTKHYEARDNIIPDLVEMSADEFIKKYKKLLGAKKCVKE